MKVQHPAWPRWPGTELNFPPLLRLLDRKGGKGLPHLLENGQQPALYFAGNRRGINSEESQLSLQRKATSRASFVDTFLKTFHDAQSLFTYLFARYTRV